MATTLLLDRTDWDLCIDAEGNIALASEPYSTTQDVASACRLFLGELWYDTTRGIRYFQSVLGKPTPIGYLKSALQAAALSVPSVQAATVYLQSRSDRSVTGQVQIVTGDGVQIVTL
jgi:hypothetical protein